MWKEAIILFNIDEMYQDANFQNAQFLPEKIIELGRRWILSKKKTSLFLSGNVGSGKTYFSICLLKELVDAGCRWVIFIKSNDLDLELLTAIEERREIGVLKKYCEVDFLFIDDLGVERLSERMQRQYHTIIDRRTANYLPTVFTSNYEKRSINEILGSRIASRLALAYASNFPTKYFRKQILLAPLT